MHLLVLNIICSMKVFFLSFTLKFIFYTTNHLYLLKKIKTLLLSIFIYYAINMLVYKVVTSLSEGLGVLKRIKRRKVR
jgi:hypothetical protein